MVDGQTLANVLLLALMRLPEVDFSLLLHLIPNSSQVQNGMSIVHHGVILAKSPCREQSSVSCRNSCLVQMWEYSCCRPIVGFLHLRDSECYDWRAPIPVCRICHSSMP